MDEAEPNSEIPVLRARSVVWALRVTAVAIVCAVGAAQYLAHTGKAARAVSLAQAPGDPETTGSITAARQVHLDPCALRR